MYSSIQYFVENGIPQLEKLQKNFMMNPSFMEACVNGVKRIMLETGCLILSEMFGECNTMLEEAAQSSYEKAGSQEEKQEKRSQRRNGEYIERCRRE